VNAAENKKSDESSSAVIDQVASPSASVSADGSSTVAPSEVETAHQATIKDTSSVPAAASVTKPTPPAGTLKRRRGRPRLYTQQASERRHTRLLEVSICCNFSDITSLIPNQQVGQVFPLSRCLYDWTQNEPLTEISGVVVDLDLTLLQLKQILVLILDYIRSSVYRLGTGTTVLVISVCSVFSLMLVHFYQLGWL